MSEQPPLVMAYLRYSSDIQGLGDSLARQELSALEYARSRGWTLAKSNIHTDPGVSAYKKKNLLKGKFSEIANKVRSGSIPPGSVLICEALDRISRADVAEALEIILNLINSGLVIITLKPEPREFRRGQVDVTALIIAIVYLGQATGESEMKAMRTSRNWERRKAEAIKNGTPLGRGCPSWLRVNNGKYELEPTAAETVREIFRLCCLGYGSIAILKRLIANGRKPIARAAWSTRYILDVIKSPSCYGLLQTYARVDGKKVLGPSIEGYYPAVVRRTTWEEANALVAERAKRPTGGPVARYVNIYHPFLVDRDGNLYTSWTVTTEDGGYRILLSRGSVAGGKWQSLREDVFEHMFFNVIGGSREYWSAFIPPDTTTDADALAALEQDRARLATLMRKITSVKQRIVSEDHNESLIDLLPSLDHQRRQLEVSIRNRQTEREVSDKDRILTALARMRPGFWNLNNDQRLEVRAILRSLIKRVRLTIESPPKAKVIKGRWMLEPAVGDKTILCTFEYRPYRGRAGRVIPSECVSFSARMG